MSGTCCPLRFLLLSVIRQSWRQLSYTTSYHYHQQQSQVCYTAVIEMANPVSNPCGVQVSSLSHYSASFTTGRSSINIGYESWKELQCCYGRIVAVAGDFLFSRTLWRRWLPRWSLQRRLLPLPPFQLVPLINHYLLYICYLVSFFFLGTLELVLCANKNIMFYLLLVLFVHGSGVFSFFSVRFVAIFATYCGWGKLCIWSWRSCDRGTEYCTTSIEFLLGWLLLILQR
jgi:hypothetical protein